MRAIATLKISKSEDNIDLNLDSHATEFKNNNKESTSVLKQTRTDIQDSELARTCI